MVDGPGELGQGVGGGADLLAQHGGRGGGRGEPHDGAAVLGPGRGQGPHGGGLPGAGGGQGELEPGPGGGHLGDQGGLPGVEGGPVGGLLEQRHGDRVGCGGVPVPQAGRGHQLLLGGQDGGAGVHGGPGDLVDAGAVDAAQHGGLVDAVRSGCQPHRGGREGVLGDQVHGRLHVLRGQVRGPDPAQRLGPHVPDLPGRAVGLHLVPNSLRGVPDPRGIDGR